MPTTWTPNSSDALKGANEAASGTRTLTLTLLGILSSLLLVCGGLNPERLLVNGAVPLPVVERTELPLQSFFAVAPWIVVALHFELLSQLSLLTEKLRLLEKTLYGTIKSERDAVLTQLNGVSFSHWLLKRSSSSILIYTQGVFVWTTVVLAPVLTILYAQLAFLPFQSEATTWSTRLALIADLLLLALMWPLIVGHKAADGVADVDSESTSQKDTVLSRLRKLRARGQLRSIRGSWSLALLATFTIWLSFLVATIPMERLERLTFLAFRTLGIPVEVVQHNFYVSNFWDQVVIGGGKVGGLLNVRTQLPEGIEVDFWRAALFDNQYSPFNRTLRLQRSDYATSTVKAGALVGMRFNFGSEPVAWPPGKEALNLEGRSFRFSYFENVFPTLANLSNADFRGAVLRNADLRRTVLRGAVLDGAEIWGSDISETDFSGAALQASILRFTKAHKTNFEGANLRRIHLYRSDLLEPSIASAALDFAAFVSSSASDFNLPTPFIAVGSTFSKVQISTQGESTALLHSNKGLVTSAGDSPDDPTKKGLCIYKPWDGCVERSWDEVARDFTALYTCESTISQTWFLRRNVWKTISPSVAPYEYAVIGGTEVRLTPGGREGLRKAIDSSIGPWPQTCP